MEMGGECKSLISFALLDWLNQRAWGTMLETGRTVERARARAPASLQRYADICDVDQMSERIGGGTPGPPLCQMGRVIVLE